MAYVSHKCVKKSENDIVYGSLFIAGAFPPQAKTAKMLRVAHKLLAVTSMIYSIDRKVAEAWDIPPLGSCVPPGIPPHCHTTISSTWNLGPGGVASWGMFVLTHHIPSPTFALVQSGRVAAPVHGDLGCGSA